MLPTKDEEERKRRRPIGRDVALYNEVLHGWLDIVKAADELGLWGAATIEHHLHSEGYEVGPNPGVLNAWWAGAVKNIRVGALGYVMATHDPIRVAEETAIIDHISRGKSFVGFARGYQSRWTNILGQYTGAVATLSDGSAGDLKNRDIFQDHVDMVLECWTKDAVSFDTPTYKAPYPADGIRGYPPNQIAREAGAPGEIDENGVVRKVSVVPRPYQSPHPPVFVATNKTEGSVRYCARRGFNPTYFGNFDIITAQSAAYVDEAAKVGRKVKLGQCQNIVRWPHFSKNKAESRQQLQDWDVDINKNFIAPFYPMYGQDEKVDWTERVLESGLYTVGTVDEVRDQWLRMFEVVPAEYVTLVFHYAQQPKEEVIRELELFMTKVVPHLESAV
jgi:alkanesulfonate monooxygenase SsuD/methylene tetrahydromethanopterin reductase-like flavin-dependent oxidoreductase (luciferase family)